MNELKAFQGEEHQPFLMNGGRPAALLVHGFPGTPAEMRPLAALLHQTGWTVQGLLLPGFGAEIATLGQRNYDEWVVAVKSALVELQRKHAPLVLVGYSMGAALSLKVATIQSPTGLILLAPFRQFGSQWQQFLGQVLRPFFRDFYPFKNADFSEAEVRQGISKFFPDLDLDDAQIQQMLRGLKLPLRIFDQLNRAGKIAYRSARQVTMPTLIIQGTQDEIVQVGDTRRLLQSFSGPLTYTEVEAGHDLLIPDRAAWERVETAVTSFAQTLTKNHGV